MAAGRAFVAAVCLALACTARAQDSDCHLAAAPGRVWAPALSAAGEDVTVTVAALYTPEAADSATSRGAPITQWISDAFADWQAVVDSAAAPGPAVTLASTAPVRLDMAETGACFDDLDDFYAHPRSAALRDSLAADLVVLFTARCSAAFQCEDISSCAPTAYAMARFDVAGDVPTGGGHALSHEAGHLLGMRHDIVSDPTPGYNHGHRNEAAGFFTVMAFRGPLPSSDMVYAYSDPRRTFGGQPLGSADVADNARVLRENAPIAANWRLGVPTEPPPVADPIRLVAAPNPATQSWRVTVSGPASQGSLELFDYMGRRVWNHALDGAGPWSVDVPAGGLAPGLYLLRAGWNAAAETQYATVRLTRSG